MLVVEVTDYNEHVLVVVGTNIIRLLKYQATNSSELPDSWQSAFALINKSSVSVVKATAKVTLQPMEVKTVTGLVRKDQNVDAVITEQLED